MFCPNCGAQIIDDSAFCPYCGTSNKAVPQSTFRPQPAAAPMVADQPPMKWFKFLIYFGLFVGALSNAATGIQMLTGSAYGDNKELVYSFADGLQTLDMIIGIVALSLAALGIYTRFRLSGYHQNGPTLLLLTYAGSIAINAIYFIGIHMVLPDFILESTDTSSLISGSIVSVIMILVNHTYFKKRASLFENP
jgi:hypothetical protein